jgi:hypothetical protein
VQLLDVSRCATREIFFHLCPDKFHWIEFRRARRKVVNVDTRMLSQKPLYFLALMNRRLVPDQYDGAAYPSQQLLQEFNDLVAGQITLVRLGTPADFATAGRNQQRANCIDPLVVSQAGPNLGRLSSRCPGSLEGTDQRLPIFVNKYKGCTQVTPLFLSRARDTVSSGRSRPRHAGRRAAVVFDNSTSYAAGDTTPRSDDTEFQTDAGSTVRYAPASNSPRRTREHWPPATGLAPVAATVAVSNDRDDREDLNSASACDAVAVFPVASVEHCGVSRPPLVQLVPGRALVLPAQVLVSDVRRAAWMSQLVSCSI